MKSIILGAFIIGLFFAVAQSISISKKHYRYPGKNTGIYVPVTSVDTGDAYVVMPSAKMGGLQSSAIIPRIK